MNREVSYYARIPEVRNLLLNYQRSLPDFGKKRGFSGIIMDGRDIGSVVLPMQISKSFFMPTFRSGKAVVYLMENKMQFPTVIKLIALER